MELHKIKPFTPNIVTNEKHPLGTVVSAEEITILLIHAAIKGSPDAATVRNLVMPRTIAGRRMAPQLKGPRWVNKLI